MIRVCVLTEEIWSGRRGSDSELSAWESKLSIVYFQHLQNRLEKMYVHALHTVHVVPDFACRCGTFAGRCVSSDAGRRVVSETRRVLCGISFFSDGCTRFV